MTEFFKRGSVLLLFSVMVSCEVERKSAGGKWVDPSSPKELAADPGVSAGGEAHVSPAEGGKTFVSHEALIDLNKHVVPFVETSHHHDSDNAGRQNFAVFGQAQCPDFHLTVEEILDQLNLGEMPPRKKSVLQPEADEVSCDFDTTEYLRFTKMRHGRSGDASPD